MRLLGFWLIGSGIFVAVGKRKCNNYVNIGVIYKAFLTGVLYVHLCQPCLKHEAPASTSDRVCSAVVRRGHSVARFSAVL